jgi:lysophospholipase L1-like esterase
MSRRLVTASLLAGFLGTIALAQTPQIAPALHPPQLTPLRFSIGGRVLPAPNRDPRFGGVEYTHQWPGIYFEAGFSGTEVYFATGKGDEILHVTVDHQPPVPLVKPAPGIYQVSGVAAGPHSVRIDVVTESQDAPDTFDGFAISASEKPLDPPHRLRQIEFIGDSHTVGYGNTSPTRTCTNGQVSATTDTSQAFGPLVARHYNADYQINAISGRGIVRNYNGFAADPMPVAYPWILFDKKQIYVDQNWHPQILVIALGTNDFSTSLNPGEKWKTRDELHADYEATYLHFLKSLRVTNPRAFFLLWATDMANGEVELEEQTVIDQWKATGEKRVAFLPVHGLQFSACNWHPSLADDRTIADRLEKSIDSVSGIWEGKGLPAEQLTASVK